MSQLPEIIPEPSADEPYLDDLEDDRAVERFRLELSGRCLLPNGLELPCQTTDIQHNAVSITALDSAELGQTIIVYLDELGRLSGEVTRIFEGGFVLALELTERKRDKLAEHIESYADRDLIDQVLSDGPSTPNINERNERLVLTDGRSYPVQIKDLSLSGASMTCEVIPALSAQVEVAGLSGRVVQHYPGGLRVEFDRAHPAPSLSELI
ncbi:type IV pilus assembly PilZ [Ahrensia sp. R2A130]|uniref:type IV pilus assembly PilZ n=1 Tax=Ahrensia sp. R2A130 TaxID=744979 RepID=UPI0001E0F827|nr:type IV pilus assembly PilZ [Ahrensia sp. R2A130]EFL90463.1 type IV pilus assembly PilZ [Ahrensia sp. R2A130]